MLLGCLLAACGASSEASAAPAATVEGGLDKPAVREVVRTHIGQVRECYNAELVENESVAGNVVVVLASETRPLPAVTLTAPADGSTGADSTPLLAGVAGDAPGNTRPNALSRCKRIPKLPPPGPDTQSRILACRVAANENVAS